MHRGPPPSNNNLSQNRARKTRISGYLSRKRKPIKASLADPVEEKKQRLIWWLRWVVFLPLSAYALTWIVIILIDLIKY